MGPRGGHIVKEYNFLVSYCGFSHYIVLLESVCFYYLHGDCNKQVGEFIYSLRPS